MKTVIRFYLRLLSVLLTAAVIFGCLYAAGAVTLGQDSTDAVSGATAQRISAEDISGKWVVLINRARHDKSGTTADWEKFFSFDENVPLIMEDVICKVARYDAGGLEAARQYQARLPENQMKIQTEPGAMLLSKAELLRFDVMILSETAANAYAAQTLYDRSDVLTLHM